MKNTYTAVIKEDNGYWIGWIKEISGVNCQEKTKSELLETLEITLAEAIEINKEESISLVGKNYEEELIFA